ncbi:hypothetical protein F53441_1769 [Fusarium austroafricanum]|uniref:RING-type domain-containing protein n=1 Tax=Fusarium austroafricanum TaxID=2364996 RepID=A0A8H4P3N5_9HYPO|nr:hypothetical protein F53441_1769 [Fusarium austroafricanum]
MSQSPSHSQPQFHGEGYWPTIREAINSGITTSDDGPMRPQCPICLEDLSVTSFPPVSGREATDGEGDPTLAEVLVCGHILCQACRQATEAVHETKRTCPVCRAPTRCSGCGTESKVFPIPKEGEAFTNSVPATVPRGFEQAGPCPMCTANQEFFENVENGKWPPGLDDLEPGFVPLFYHIVRKLEQQDRPVTEASIAEAITTIVYDEYKNMTAKRLASAILGSNAHHGQNPWSLDIMTSDPNTDVEQDLRNELAQSSVTALARQSQPILDTHPEGGQNWTWPQALNFNP